MSHDGLEIHWREHGERVGRPLVLVHGLFWSTYQFDRYARLMPDRWLVAVDTRGHGASSRPTDPRRYTWDSLASDVLAVLDALEVPEAVVGGMSLGANVSLAVALHSPERVAGLVLEMPVLSVSEVAARQVFHVAGRIIGGAAALFDGLRRRLGRLPVPSSPPEIAALRDFLSQDPAAAIAVIEGLAASPVPDHGLDALAAMEMPALVTGHRFDPVHRIADAAEISRRLPRARFLPMESVWDFFLRPRQYSEAITEFLTVNGL